MRMCSLRWDCLQGAHRKEDFGTEQLSAYTQSREMTLQQEELFNLSPVKNDIQDEACAFVVPVSSRSLPQFFFLTRLVSIAGVALMRLLTICFKSSP